MFVKVVLLAVVLTQVLAGSNDRQRLLRDLMKDYMKEVEPNATPLKMGVSFMCASLESDTNRLTSKLLEKYAWQDNRLVWDPTQYGGVTLIRVPAKMIWTPDVKLYTTQDEAEVRDEVNVVLMSNGSIIWIPMVLYKTHCTRPTDPKDHSTSCYIQIGSWTYDAHTLDLQLDGEGFDTHMYQPTCPYIIQDPEVEVKAEVYPCCPEPYASMHIKFKVTPRQ